MEKQDAMRIFVAVEIDDGVRREIAAIIDELKQKPHAEDVRWIRPQNLHVTLRFIGEVFQTRVARLSEHIAEAIKDIPPLAIQLGSVHAFPEEHPRLFSIMVTPSPDLIRLSQAVEHAAVASGFTAELRPFTPHLTLGRKRGDHLPVFEHFPVRNVGAFEAEEVIVFRSELTENGPVHTPLIRLPL